MNDVKSARRVLDILRFFAEERAPASLARVSAALAFPNRVASHCWRPWSPRAMPIRRTAATTSPAAGCAAEVVATTGSRCAAAPRCKGWARSVGETVILAQLAQKQVVYLDVIEPGSVLRFSAFVGQRKPLHAAASGRALLAALSARTMQRIAESLDYEKFTPHTPSNAKALVKAMEAGRRRGWHVNLGEHQADTASIAGRWCWTARCSRWWWRADEPRQGQGRPDWRCREARGRRPDGSSES